MNIAIVEDMQVGIDLLENLLFDYARQRRLSLDVDSFTSAEEFLKNYHPYRYTIIFMDIFMDGIDGMEAAERIREVDSGTLLIFQTASGDHMPQAFNVHAYDYIQKPFNITRLYHLLDEILELQNGRSRNPRLSFISNRHEQSIPFSQIECIASRGNYLEVTDWNGTVYKTRMTFSEAADQLSKDTRFLMILRGVLVNMDHVIGFRDNTCYLEGDIILPVNIKNARKIEQTWNNYNFTKKRSASIPWSPDD